MLSAESRQPFQESVAVLRQTIPDSEQVTIPNATHALEITNRKPVAEAIAAFLRKHRLR